MSAAEQQSITDEMRRHHERKENHKCCMIGLVAISALVIALASVMVIYHPS